MMPKPDLAPDHDQQKPRLCLRCQAVFESLEVKRELFADLDLRATLQTLFTQFQPIPLTGVYWTSL